MILISIPRQWYVLSICLIQIAIVLWMYCRYRCELMVQYTDCARVYLQFSYALKTGTVDVRDDRL